MNYSFADNRATYGRVSKPPKLDGSISNEEYVPIQHKYALTIEQAAKYTSIGETRLRTMVANNPNAEYILYKGTQVLLKREVLEKYLNGIHAI